MQNKAFTCEREKGKKLEADTARRQENINEQNEIQAKYQTSIDNNRAETKRMNAQSNLYQNLAVMADIIMGNSTNDYTFREVAKAFDEMASDYSLNLSDKSRQVYKTISQAYAG